MKLTNVWSKPIDQRYFQVAFLASLTAYGALVLGIPHLSLDYIGTILLTSQGVQWLFSRALSIPFDFRSPLISTFSLSLLVSSQSLLIAVLIATLMVASKFLLRVDDKHIFNPANFALVVTVMLFPGISAIMPGQWGASTIIAALVVLISGILVTRSVRRHDIAFYFLGFHFLTLLLFVSLGYLSLPQMSAQFASVALLLFTFFMITDPKTIPNTKKGRLLYAGFCAGFGGILHFIVGVQPGFIYALFIAALFLPAIDRVFGGEKFEWTKS